MEAAQVFLPHMDLSTHGIQVIQVQVHFQILLQNSIYLSPLSTFCNKGKKHQKHTLKTETVNHQTVLGRCTTIQIPPYTK